MNQHKLNVPITILAITAITFMAGGGVPDRDEFTTEFRMKKRGMFVPTSDNPYFTLRPGKFLRLEGDDDGEFVRVDITFTDELRPILFHDGNRLLFAMTRVVEEREWIDGELVEISRNYFAACQKTSDVFYFGEEVDIYENGQIVSHDGAWLAGENGAEPGLIMPGTPLNGAKYYQEIAVDVALDRAEHVGDDLTVTVPLNTYKNCIKVVETTPLEPGSESIKFYAPEIGLIHDDGIELVEARKTAVPSSLLEQPDTPLNSVYSHIIFVLRMLLQGG